MSFARSYIFTLYLALFFLSVDLLAMEQVNDDKIVKIPLSIAHLKKRDDGAHEMESSRGKGNFVLLPDEVILLIFKFLSRQELGSLASVSWEMKQFSEDNSLWHLIAGKRGLPINASNSGVLSVKQMFRERLKRAWIEQFQECR